MIEAIPMTEKSWILYNKSERCGLMRLIDETGYSVLGGPYAGKYDDLKNLKDTVKDITFKKLVVNKEQEKAIVSEFPVKHDPVFEAGIEEGVHLYTKIEGSKDVYAAGYFSVKTKNKWQTVFCPRYKTLGENLFHGPYKSKMDAENETKIENKKE